MQTRGWLTLTVVLASCVPAPVAKDPGPAHPDPPEPEAPVETSAPAPATAVPVAEERPVSPWGDPVLEWLDQVRRSCERRKDPEAYLPLREGLSAEDVEAAKTRCADGAEVGLRGAAWTASLRACVDRFVKANGAGPSTCRLKPKDVPDVPASLFDRHLAQCSAACAEAGPEALALKKERAKPAMCCDGTASSCSYGNVGPGCCAGHGGVCIE